MNRGPGGRMNFRGFAARFALVAACSLMTATPAFAHFWQCVPYARKISGINIHGNANTWWSQAKGRYERGHEPREGAVLAFASHGKMRLGHVAMVSEVVSDREIRLTHANWSRPGRVETGVRAVDVSPNNDWSEVKVWYGPIGDLGTTVYPTKGFIYAGAPADDDTLDAPVVIAGSKARAANMVALAAVQKF